MAARSVWKGAIDFAGFPVNVAAYPTKKSATTESFKLVSPSGEAVEQFYRDPQGNLYKMADLGRGVMTGEGLVPIPQEALDMIASAERSSVVEADYFAPIDSLPMELIEDSYQILPDSRVAGSTRSANLIWNGLLKERLAYITQVQFKSGSKDRIMAIYANDHGLVGVTFPFIEDLHMRDAELMFEVDEKQAEMFSKVVDKKSTVKVFSLDDFKSRARERRELAIKAALEGKEILPRTEAAAPAGLDLMAALEAQLA